MISILAAVVATWVNPLPRMEPVDIVRLDDQTVLVCANDGHLYKVDVTGRTQMTALNTGFARLPRFVGYANQRLVFIAENGLNILDIAKRGARPRLYLRSGGLSDDRVTPDGRFALVVLNGGKRASVMSVTGSSPKRVVQLSKPFGAIGQGANGGAVVVDHGSKTLITVAKDLTVRKKPLPKIMLDSYIHYVAALSDDVVLCLGLSRDFTGFVWNHRTNAVDKFTVPDGPPTGLHISFAESGVRVAIPLMRHVMFCRFQSSALNKEALAMFTSDMAERGVKGAWLTDRSYFIAGATGMKILDPATAPPLHWTPW